MQLHIYTHRYNKILTPVDCTLPIEYWSLLGKSLNKMSKRQTNEAIMDKIKEVGMLAILIT